MTEKPPVTDAAPQGDAPRKPRRIESFTILFMVALGWTCSSSHGNTSSATIAIPVQRAAMREVMHRAEASRPMP